MAQLASSTIYGDLAVNGSVRIGSKIKTFGNLADPYIKIGSNDSSRDLYIGGASYSELGFGEATIGVTGGNLHLDPASGDGIYLNHYTGGDKVYIDGNKAATQSWVSSNFSNNSGDITGVTAGNALTGGGSSGSVTINHADTSTQGNVNTSGGTIIDYVNTDGYGHVTGMGTRNLSAGDIGAAVSGHNHPAGDITSGTMSTNRLPKQEQGISITGNFGQWQDHGAYQDFNTDVSYWGWNFVQSNTNAPQSTSGQWYRNRLALGDSYGFGSGTGSDYWLEMAIPRESHASKPDLWIRVCESGTIESWYQVGSKISGNTTWHDGNVSGGGGISVGNTSISHSNTSSQGDINTSGSTIIDNIYIDGYGHVTSMGTRNLSYSDVGAASSGHNHNGDTIYPNTIYIGDNGSADSNAYFYDDNSNTWRTFQWDDSISEWRVEDNGGSMRRLYHEGHKPTTGEIGAAASGHTHPGSDITDATSSATANKIMERNSSGDVWCRLFRSTYSSTNSNIAGIYTTQTIGGDYMRPSTPSQVKSALSISESDITDFGNYATSGHTHDGRYARKNSRTDGYVWVRRNSSGSALYVTNQSTGDIARFYQGTGDGTQQASVSNNGTFYGNDFDTGSDKRIKKDIEQVEDVLSIFNPINLYSFQKENKDYPEIGLIAQEVQKGHPLLTGTTDHDEYDEILTLSAHSIASLAVGGVKELIGRTDTMTSETDKLKKKVEDQQEQINDLKEKLEELK